MSLGSVVSWVAGNWSNILAMFLVLIGAASLFIKALEGLVKALVAVFPKLQTADGELVKVAAWLDALAKSSWLNTAAASPKAADK